MEPQQNRQRGGVAHPFPGRLHKLLQLSELDPALACIISWNEDGSSFRVHDKKTFEQEIQPTYFAQTKYASFRRQLNLWSFQRLNSKGQFHTVKDVKEGYSYAHPLFRRDEPNLCDKMKRSGAAPTSSQKKKTSVSMLSSCAKENHSESMQFGKIFKPVLAAESSAMTSSINSTKHALDPMLVSQDGLGNTNSAAEVMKQLKAKEMYLRARLSEVKRLEDNMKRIRQEKSAFKEETHQQRIVQHGQSRALSPIPLSDDVFHSIGSNYFSTREQQNEDASVVSIESTQNQRATFGPVTRQGESYPRRRSSCNISKKDADLLLDLLADE